jgi:membrane protein DedA with SNARE-associated domain
VQPAPLPGFLQSLGPLVSRHGYLVVAGFLFFEAFAIPVPGETVLLTAALYAGTGRLNLILIILIGSIATFLGSCVGYALGFYGGRALVSRFGRYIGLTQRRFVAAEAFFKRQGPKIIVLARFIEGLRQANGIIAGTSGMPLKRFLIFNAIGSVIWVTTWSLIGDLAGSHVGAIYSDITHYFWIALIVIVLAAALVIARHLRHRSRSKADVEVRID